MDKNSFIEKLSTKGVTDIVVLGHSLGLIDAPYFRMINKRFFNGYI